MYGVQRSGDGGCSMLSKNCLLTFPLTCVLLAYKLFACIDTDIPEAGCVPDAK